MEQQNSKYQGYFQRYIGLVDGMSLLELMESQSRSALTLLESIPFERWNFSYAAEKWSIKELVGHVNDTERIMCYRALCFARADKQELNPFDENEYVANARFNELEPGHFLEEFEANRRAMMAFFRSLNTEELSREGKFSGAKITVEGIGFLICGHWQHHLNILNERYL